MLWWINFYHPQRDIIVKMKLLGYFPVNKCQNKVSLQFFLPLLVHGIFSLFPKGDLQISKTLKSFLPLWSQPQVHFTSTVIVSFSLSLKTSVIYANGSQDFLIIWILNTTYFMHESPVFIFLVLWAEYKYFTVTLIPWHGPAPCNAQPYILCFTLIMSHFRLSTSYFYKDSLYVCSCIFPSTEFLSLSNFFVLGKHHFLQEKNAHPLSLSASCISLVFWNTRGLYSYKIVLCFLIYLLPDFIYQRSIMKSVVLWWYINIYSIHWQPFCAIPRWENWWPFTS